MNVLRAGALAVLAVAAFATPAAAAEPTIDQFEFSGGPDVFADACGPGIDLIGTFRLKGTAILFIDESGDPIREQVHLDFFGTLTRSDTGNTISDPTHVLIVFDFIDGTKTDAGLEIRRTYPGEGLIAHDVGRLVSVDASGEILFIAGPHDVLLGGSSIPAVCAALS